VNFLNLPAVEIGLRFLERLGIDAIHARVQALAARLLERLDSLRHSNDAPAATIYGPRELDRRGATVAFNFLHPDGRVVDERYVDRVARQHTISLRTGCFCNPGAGEVAFTISRETLVGGEFGQGMTLDDYIHVIGLPSGGPCAPRSGSPPTPPTSTASPPSPASSSTSQPSPTTYRHAPPAKGDRDRHPAAARPLFALRSSSGSRRHATAAAAASQPEELAPGSGASGAAARAAAVSTKWKPAARRPSSEVACA
jgi:hypothetical protein